MSDGRNRLIAIILGVVLLAGGGLVLLQGVGVFGSRRSNEPLIDGTVVHWWHEGGTLSYVVVGLIGLVLFALGTVLATREWHRNDGRSRTGTIVFPNVDSSLGQTTLHTPSLSHMLEADVSRLPDVGKALVGLFGTAPDVELRSVMDVSDDVDIGALTGQFDEALSRVEKTVGFRPHPVQVTLRFRGARAQRALE